MALRKTVYQHQCAYKSDLGEVSLINILKRSIARSTPGIAASDFVQREVSCQHLVYNAYDNETFSNIIPWENRSRDLVFVGRLVTQKGCDVLLKALFVLRRNGITPNLSIVGDGPELSRLRDIVIDYELQDQVLFAGVLQGSALAKTLNSHQFIVTPSTYEEPFGIVAIEGLACGCVPLVSVRGGLVNAIGPHGFTFQNGDANDLARIIGNVLAHPAKAKAALLGAKQHLRGYTRQVVASKYLQILSDLIDSGLSPLAHGNSL